MAASLSLVAGHVATAAAQHGSGRIVGRVVSSHTGDPVATAQIYLPGTSIGSLSDVNGRFVLNDVPAGTHTVAARTLGYGTKNVADVRVTAGEVATLEFSLAPEAIAMEEITVSATRERGSTAALLGDRQRSAAVVDAIGSEQISRSAGSDAASALRRVPGVSVVEGKFVYVRGLGERYGATTLNGAPLPSPLPDKKAVPLDLIPAGLLESVVTAKSYSPDQPGDYAGGLVQLETRSGPSAELLRVSTSMGFETLTSLGAGLGYSGGGWDWAGFDDGTRALPTGVSPTRPVELPGDPQLRNAFVRSLSGPWSPAPRRSVPLNAGLGATYGNRVEVGGRELAFIGSGSYSTSYSTTGSLTERYYVLGDAPSLQVDYDGQVTTHDVALGGLANASLELNDTDHVDFNLVYNRLVEDEARTLTGLYESQGPYIRAPRLRYIANELVTAQLRGEHTLRLLGAPSLRWRAGYSDAGRYEPNTRTVLYRAEERTGPYVFYPGPSSGLVFHQDLSDRGLNGAVDLKVPFRFRSLPSSLSLGGAAEVRGREVYTRRFRLVPNGALPREVQTLSPDELFAEERIGTGAGQLGVVESTFREDNYDADQSIYAGYGMVDAEVLPRLRVVAGGRVEAARQRVSPRDLFATPLAALHEAELENVDVLPAVNLTYAANEQTNLRLGLSGTVARPQFRELTPFLYADYYGGEVTRGNPYLIRSRIQSSELRWEWFAGQGALVSAGVFHKRFVDPIEPFSLVLGSAPAATWVNTENASLSGLELELRAPLAVLSPALESLSLDLNLTVASSRVRGDSVLVYNPSDGAPLTLAARADGDRPLFGQSPYVINLSGTYAPAGAATRASVLFNRFGRRLDSFGGAGLPDIYEEGRDQLDLVLEQGLWGGMAMKVTASGLLGRDVRFVQTFPGGETVTTRSHELGRKFSVSLSWSPGEP